MISIRKYLYGTTGNATSAAEPQLGEGLFHFSTGVLDGFQQYLFTSGSFDALRSELQTLKDSVRPDWGEEEAAESLISMGRILTAYRDSAQQTALTQAVELQHIFAMLNQALIVLAEGRDQSVARLSKIQDSLQRASMIQDIVALKWSLADTIRFVKEESVEAQSGANQQLARFDAEVARTREFLGSSRTVLGGRPEGISKVAESLKNIIPGQAVYVIAFLFERLQNVIHRYGPAVADELLFRLIKERIQPVAPSNTAYRWTSSSLVAVTQRGRDLEKVRSEIAELNCSPLVHRICLGNRTAVLTVTPSHLVAEGVDGAADPLVEQIDKFTGLQS